MVWLHIVIGLTFAFFPLSFCFFVIMQSVSLALLPRGSFLIFPLIFSLIVALSLSLFISFSPSELLHTLLSVSSVPEDVRGWMVI